MEGNMLSNDLPMGLTFDDVILVPQFSDFLPADTDTSIALLPGITLNIPVFSAAMDTVTEARLAISLAREGDRGHSQSNESGRPGA